SKGQSMTSHTDYRMGPTKLLQIGRLEVRDDSDVLRGIRKHSHTFRPSCKTIGKVLQGDWKVLPLVSEVLRDDLEVLQDDSDGLQGDSDELQGDSDELQGDSDELQDAPTTVRHDLPALRDDRAKSIDGRT